MVYQIDSKAQLETLRLLYVILACFFILIVFFALYNVLFYLRRLPRQSWMIITYYVLTMIQATLHAIFFLLLSAMPGKSPFFYDSGGDNDRLYLDLLELVGSQLDKIIDWMVVTIAYQLSLALQVLIRRKTIENSKRYTYLMFLFVVIINIAEISLLIATGYIKEEEL